MNRRFWAGVFMGLGVAIVLLFTFRLMHVLRRGLPPPRPEPLATITDVTLIRDWMTIPYIAHTYGVPDEFLFDALEIPERDNRKKSLDEINHEFFPGQTGFVIDRVQQAVHAFQANAPLPPLLPLPVNAPLTPTP
ncbi:MAG: hypothetical protein AB1649_16575 [Chloroflexota bacterium]